MPIHFMIGYSAKSVLNNEFFEANVEFFSGGNYRIPWAVVINTIIRKRYVGVFLCIVAKDGC
jgi:hypothetical protein